METQIVTSKSSVVFYTLKEAAQMEALSRSPNFEIFDTYCVSETKKFCIHLLHHFHSQKVTKSGRATTLAA
jgi:hypothetical protein